jgi:hypothetical protein
MKGFNTKTPENLARAQEMRAQRIPVGEIANALGVARSTVSVWLNDPDLAKAKARRESYSQPCQDCGKPTDGSGGFKEQRTRCRGCQAQFQHDNAYWTRDRVLEAVREFARRYGRPPTAYEWNPAQARGLGKPEVADRFYADGCWPWQYTVFTTCGGWNAAIEAAGFDSRPAGHRLAMLEQAA